MDEERMTKDEEFQVRCAYTIMYANELTTSLAWELLEKVKGLKGRNIGTRAKNLRLELNRYKFKLNDTVKKSMQFYADYSDIRDSDMMHHVDMLYYAINGIVINHDVEHPDVLSFAELVRLIADYSVAVCINVSKYLKRETGYEMLPWMKITGIFGALEQLSKELCLNYAHENVNVNTEPVLKAADIFFKKLIGNGVVSAVYEANELNQKEVV